MNYVYDVITLIELENIIYVNKSKERIIEIENITYLLSYSDIIFDYYKQIKDSKYLISNI